jgi:predicted N-acetyltransferase YhbS
VHLELRPGTSNDIKACAVICYAAFEAIADQHNFPRDFPSLEASEQLIASLLSRDDIYSVVAETNSRVIGSNFLWETAPIVGVGPITVDPAVQNSTVGRRLMENVLERARDQRFAGVRLVQAAYHNRSLSLYAKLGFDVREPLATLQGSALGLKVPSYVVRPATTGDVAPVTGCTSGSTATSAGRNSSTRSRRKPRRWSSTAAASQDTPPRSAFSAMP